MFGKRFNFIRLCGIQIGIDLSWLLIAILLSWTLATGYFPFLYVGLSKATYWLMGVLGMLGLFLCIVLHELGHALVAKHYKLPISQITLFLFGGVAEIKKEPDSPKVELLVAIAGPIVSVLLCGFFYLVSFIGHAFLWPIFVTGITSYLATINGIIVLFNLIPAFPLDGGRVLRALLWHFKKNLAWATKVSTTIGSGFGLFLIFFGIFTFISGNLIGGIWMTILGIFLQRASSGSRMQFYVNRELRGETVLKFMKKEPESISPKSTITEMLENHFYVSHHHLYPVTCDKKLVGYVTLREIKSVSPETWSSRSVDSIMAPLSCCPIVSPKTNALEALNLMNEVEFPTLFVVEESCLVGILTSQDLFKLISLKLELEEK